MKIKVQQDIKDCGLIVLQSFYEHFYKEEIDINQFKLKVDYGLKGINIDNLSKVGYLFGLELKAYHASFKEALELKGYFVSIINSGYENHYVICKKRKNKIEVLDPIEGKMYFSFEEFEKVFTEKLIFINKINKKIKIKKLTSPFSYLKNKTKVIGMVLAVVIIELLISFVMMGFMKIVMDKILPGMMNDLLLMIVVSFIWISFIRSFASYFSKICIKKININIERDLTISYYEKLFSGKIQELNKLENGDYLRREGLITEVSIFLSESLFALFSDVIKFTLSISLLIYISPSLFGITFAAGILILLFSIINISFIKAKYNDYLKYSLEYMQNTIDIINSFELLKNPIAKGDFRDKFKNSYKNLIKCDYSVFKVVNIIDLITNIILWTMPILISYFAINFIFSSKISVGSFLLFLTLFNYFINPIKNFSNLYYKYIQYLKNSDLLNYVLNIEEEKLNQFGVDTGKIKSIGLNNALIGYDRPLLNVNIRIENDIQFSGKNGIGKSTLLKSIAMIKIIKEIQINSLEVEEQDIDILRTKIFYTCINDKLHSGTILDVITYNNLRFKEEFFNNIKKYNLLKLFKDLKISLDTKIVNGGENLSSGQNQIIKLLRLFTKKFDLIILDEALENIDAIKIAWFKKAIKNYQQGIFIEVSHSKNYISIVRNEVDVEKFVNV